MSSPSQLTSSEIVLVHGKCFANRKWPIGTALLDGGSGVSGKQLVTNMLKAALLAHEQADTIRFEIEEGGKQNLHASRSLVVIPTGKTVDWPHATMESRLLLERTATVADIVFDWLGEDSSDPWDRAAEQGKIMLVLRGVAEVRSSWRGRTYAFADDARAAASQNSPQSTEALLAHCRENQPEVWKLLDTEIQSALKRRTRRGRDSNGDPDPWESEAEADYERFAPQTPVVRVTGKWGVLLMLVGVGLAFLDRWAAIQNDLIGFTAVTAASITLVWGLLVLQLKPLRNIERRFSAWVRDRVKSRFPSLGSLPEQTPMSVMESLVGFVFLVPLSTFLALIAAVIVKARPILLLIAAGAAAGKAVYGGYRLLQKKAAARINAQVVIGKGNLVPRPNVAPPAKSVPAPDELATAPEPLEPNMNPALTSAMRKLARAQRPVDSLMRDAESPSDNDPMPISLETVSPDAIPPVTEESRRRVDAISLRAPAIRSTYRKGVAFLAVSTTLLAVAYWLAGPTPLLVSPEHGVQFSERTPWFVASSLLATLLLLRPRAAAWLRARALEAFVSAILTGRVSLSLGIPEPDETTASVRPIALRLLGAYWVVIGLLRGPNHYASLAPPLPLVFIPVSLAVALGYLYWIHRSVAIIERRYPYQPPLNLLALRVFNSSCLVDFLSLSNAWQWIGTRQMLGGPDTAGHKAHDLLNYFAGRIDKSIIEDATELREALDAFRMRPDNQLRFPVNSIQCNNATWKEALQCLLDQADVVVMDLSGLSEQNRGAAYELGKLVNEVPLNRVVLLYDDTTDLSVFKDILMQACKGMAADSPNRQSGGFRVRAFYLGGPTGRAPNESVYDWKRRMRARMEEQGLVGLLCDAAQPPRTAIPIDPKCDWDLMHWSRIMPRLLRWVLNVIAWIFLFSVVTVSSCQVAHSG